MSSSPFPRSSALTAVFACIAGGMVPLQSPLALGQTYSVLDSFNGSAGQDPWGSLIITGSTLYGVGQERRKPLRYDFL